MKVGIGSEVSFQQVSAASANPNEDRATPKRMACLAGAAIGSFGGLLSLFLGLLCSVGHGLIESDALLDEIGTVLMIVGIPMMLAGSAFMDRVARLDR